MITIRPAKERGHANHGWLDTNHTFSFANYYDPAHMGFRSLRVINEDRVAPGKGFGMHQHRDMEILTYVLEGALEHRDSLGTGSIIKPGDVQKMSAGSGIAHSEFNPSQDEPVHFLQIWIMPDRAGIKPSYEQKVIPQGEEKLQLIAAPTGDDGTVYIQQDVNLYRALLDSGDSVTHPLQPDRHAWIQVTRGDVMLNGQLLRAGDGAAVSDEEKLEIEAKENAEVLVFDLG
jgi:redox-sensitive bicupin YhaK (pirin superfamily)